MRIVRRPRAKADVYGGSEAAIRILHVLDHSIPIQTGYTFRTRAILEHQRALGWETEHVTSTKHYAPSPPVEEVAGLRFHRTEKRSFLHRFPVLRQLGVIRDLRRKLRELVVELKPDILHAHSPALTGVAAVQVGREAGIPVVYEVRAFWEDAAVDHGTSREGGLRYRLTRSLENWVLRRAAAVTTICEGLKSDIVSRGLDAAKVTVIPNAVDISRFRMLTERDAALESELGLAGKRVLGFVGSFYAYEGLPLLVEALPRILRDHPETRLLLVGGGQDLDRIRATIGKLGVEDAVVQTGRVPFEEVGRYYSLCDAMVYPRHSMRLTELVTPLKPLEAMAQGKLVIASDVGGHRELIRPGETGLLFEAGNAAALGAAVGELLSQPERWDAMRAAGRRFVEEERNWAASVARYVPIYERLAGQDLVRATR